MESGCNTLRRLNSKTAGISHERSADQGSEESCDNRVATEKYEKERKTEDKVNRKQVSCKNNERDKQLRCSVTW